jgi:hypothetical protein
VKIVFSVVAILFPLLSVAKLSVGYGTGSYFGRHQAQVNWTTNSEYHQFYTSIGYTKDRGVREIRQVNASYLYSGFTKSFDNFKWNPFLAGPFITYTDNKNFYIDAPLKYNDPNYYDWTSFRTGIRFGSEIVFQRPNEKNLHLVLDGTLLEESFLAFFNNTSEYQVFLHFWSIGFSVRMDL